MIQKWFHYTNADNLESIIKNGLQVNSGTHLTEGGSWADQVYKMRPIYLCLHEHEGYQNECDVLLEVISDQEMTADLPGLVDLGAFFELDGDSGYLWWQNDEDIPKELFEFHDDEYGIDIVDLATPGHPAARAAISVTQTAVCLNNISPEQVGVVCHEEMSVKP